MQLSDNCGTKVVRMVKVICQDGGRAQIGKNLKSLLQNHWTYSLEAWYVALGAWLSTNKFVQTITLGWPWPTLQQGQIWSLRILNRKKVKHFSKAIVVYDIREDKYKCLWVPQVKAIWQPWPKVSWTAGLLTLQRTFSLQRLGQFQLNFICIFPTIGERKFVRIVQITWSSWRLCPNMVKPLKILSESPRLIALKHGM